ncbi:MAG: hypothetical protein KBD06_02050 [Candidatus Pacebacteria bacterium]|nr:hypothetical protein [Candidatus Paceibacterota bacterium]
MRTTSHRPDVNGVLDQWRPVAQYFLDEYEKAAAREARIENEKQQFMRLSEHQEQQNNREIADSLVDVGIPRYQILEALDSMTDSERLAQFREYANAARAQRVECDQILNDLRAGNCETATGYLLLRSSLLEERAKTIALRSPGSPMVIRFGPQNESERSRVEQCLALLQK